MHRYVTVIQKINYVLFILVVFLLPFPQIFLRYTVVAWGISWLLEGRWLRKPQPSSFFVPCLLFAIWFAWEGVSALWAGHPALTGAEIERHLAIPMLLPVALWGVNDYYDLRMTRRVLMYGCLAAVPVYFFTMFWVFNHTCIEQAPEHLAAQWMPMKFFAENVSAIKHRLFLSSVEMIGIIAVCHRRKELQERYGTVEGWMLTIAAVAAMSTLVVATGSRASLFTGIALIAITMIEHTPARRRMLTASAALVTVIAMSICIVEFHPRMQTFEWDHLKLEKLDADRNARLNIWSMALEHPQDYLWHGVGAGNSTVYLQERYAAHGYTTYIQRSYNSHNQYLTELLELGIFGLLLFCAAWFSMLYFPKKGKARQTAAYLTAIYMLNMFTDNMFGRFDGLALFCACMLICILYERIEFPLIADGGRLSVTGIDNHSIG